MKQKKRLGILSCSLRNLAAVSRAWRTPHRPRVHCPSHFHRSVSLRFLLCRSTATGLRLKPKGSHGRGQRRGNRSPRGASLAHTSGGTGQASCATICSRTSMGKRHRFRAPWQGTWSGKRRRADITLHIGPCAKGLTAQSCECSPRFS